MRGLTTAAITSAALAVLSVGAAAVIVLEPFEPDSVDAASDDAEASEESEEAEEAEPEIEVTDLTEGLEPFDLSSSEDYYAVTWHDLVWVPSALDSEWDVFYQESSRAVDWGYYVDDENFSSLNCGDIRNKAEFYPKSLDDPEAWYQAELDRYADLEAAGDEYELVSGPTYTHYLIDGQEALLVEYARHWTKSEDSEGTVLDVDWNMSIAYLYIDLPTDAGTADAPVTTARCRLQAVAPDSATYETGLDTVLGIRLWLE